ncbi:MAG TPA: SDR family oxidoreductase [Actinospica sp.]|jgi:nucleoside-diphosphate-sugar epimerase|nr:SDR family oxidoreductase [Actinospica sp.]
MRVFVTGASGHIGSAVVPELRKAGHEVLGLARSDTSAAAIEAMGAQAQRGDTADLNVLRKAATESDAVIHLAFDHAAIPAGKFAEAAAADLDAVRTMCDALEGTGKAFIGIGMPRPTVAAADPEGGTPEGSAPTYANPRAIVWQTISEYTDRGVRTVLVAVPNVTHSDLDQHGFAPTLIRIARSSGISAYVGEGTNTWSAGHTRDVARLFALAVEKAPAGSHLIAAGEPPVPVRTIAESIARHLGIEPVSLTPDQAAEHFKAFPFISMSTTIPANDTRTLLGWEPTHPTLLEDLDAGFYFTAADNG